MLSDQLSTVFLNLSFNKVGGFKKNMKTTETLVCVWSALMKQKHV